jgi:hypothetical protein
LYPAVPLICAISIYVKMVSKRAGYSHDTLRRRWKRKSRRAAQDRERGDDIRRLVAGYFCSAVDLLVITLLCK